MATKIYCYCPDRGDWPICIGGWLRHRNVDESQKNCQPPFAGEPYNLISNICHQYQPYLIIDIFNELLLSDTRPVWRPQVGGDSKVARHPMDALNCCYFLFWNKVTENARLGPQGCFRKLHYRGSRSPQHSIIQYLIIVEPGSLASSHAFLPSRTCRQCPTSTSTRLARLTDVSNTSPWATTFSVTQVSGASVY